MNEIDLHGIRHEDVGRVLDLFIWDNMKCGQTSLKVITGNSERMKSIVADIADEYGFVVEDGFSNAFVLLNMI